MPLLAAELQSHEPGLITDKITTNHRTKTRLQVQIKRKPDAVSLTTNEVHYTSTLDAINKIIADEGISGLYSGIHGALLGVASTNFAYFYWYSIVRTLST